MGEVAPDARHPAALHPWPVEGWAPLVVTAFQLDSDGCLAFVFRGL